MSKELTPLEALENIKTLFIGSPIELSKQFETIETALKHYEEGIKNSKTYVPHSAKNALFDLQCLAMKNTHRDFWRLPEQLANDVKKELKALEIIKSKEMLSLFKDISGKCFIVFNTTAIEIPKEEYYLLKEALL